MKNGKAPSVTGGASRKSLHAPLRARETLSVHPLMVDSMKELQSMAVRLKTPIAIIPKLPNADPPVRIAEQAHEGIVSVLKKQTRGLPSVCHFTIGGRLL
jgi:hypothetical protein